MTLSPENRLKSPIHLSYARVLIVAIVIDPRYNVAALVLLFEHIILLLAISLKIASLLPQYHDSC